MNAYYALDDVKKRTKKYYNKHDGIQEDKDQAEGDDGDMPVAGDNKGGKDLLDDHYIFKHFYQNKI